MGPPFAEVHVTDAIAKTDEERAAVRSQTEPAVEIGLSQGPQDLLLTLAAQVEGEKDAVNFGRRVRVWRVTFQLGTEEVGPRVVASVLEELLDEKLTQLSDKNALRNNLGGSEEPGRTRLPTTTSTRILIAWEQRTIWFSETGAELTGSNLAGSLHGAQATQCTSSASGNSVGLLEPAQRGCAALL